MVAASGCSVATSHFLLKYVHLFVVHAIPFLSGITGYPFTFFLSNFVADDRLRDMIK